MRFCRSFLLILLVLSLPLCAYAQSNNVTNNYTPNTPPEILLLVQTAIDEIGYTESSIGETKYGEWTGDSRAEWCAEFVCWCVDQTDKNYNTNLLDTIYPNYTGQNVGRDWFIEKGRYVDRKGHIPSMGYQWFAETGENLRINDYIPRTGDFMFLGYNSGYDTSHVALVEYCDTDADGQTTIHVIEGNNPDKVQRNEYSLDMSQILGYGSYTKVANTTLRFGNKSTDVEKIQKQLNRLYMLDDTYIDGVFNQATVDAIKDFQKNLPQKLVNGIADKRTQLELQKQYDNVSFYYKETWSVTD